MQDFIQGIIEFNKTAMSDSFIREEKRVCNSIQNVLSQVYLNDGDEIELVEKTVETLNSSGSFHFKLESMFIHGNRSQIEFDYYGKKAKKELGDLLIVSTLTRSRSPLLQKLTVIQAKRDTNKPYTWGIDKEQLYFLSNWPEFRGVMGIFPQRDIAIPDFSGCLGSYYLYREPGDFVFISAKELENSLASKKRITFDELLTFQSEANRYISPSRSPSLAPLLPPSELFHLYEDFLFRHLKRGYILPLFPYYAQDTSRVLQNIHFSRNVNDAIGNFARLNIGEPIFSKSPAISVNEFGYRMLNTIIRYIARTEEGRLGQLIEFNGDAPFFEEVEMRGIRIGIVHTITEALPG